MDQKIIQLLSAGNPRQAQEFVLSFGEHRSASWADAHRQAGLRAASQKHLPHYRGQLRHQLGETALVNAAQTAKAGYIPMRTIKPGGVFMVARLGRFGLVSLSVANRKALPRRSPTRRLLSSPNEDLDPQHKLFLSDRSTSRGATELAYFGCMVACPSSLDPAVPYQIVFAVPDATLTNWIEWVPLTKLYACLQDLIEKDGPSNVAYSKPILDRRIPTFRLPKQGRKAGDEEAGA